MSERSLPLTLTGLEIVFLADSIRNADTKSSIENELPELRALVLKLCSIYNEVVSESGVASKELTIYVTQEMVWLLRSKVRTGDIAIDNKTNIGVPLCRKFHELLTEFYNGLEDFSTVDNDEKLLTEETKTWLREGFNASRSNDNPNPDADSNADNGS